MTVVPVDNTFTNDFGENDRMESFRGKTHDDKCLIH
jgi:hypothetical protein